MQLHFRLSFIKFSATCVLGLLPNSVGLMYSWNVFIRSRPLQKHSKHTYNVQYMLIATCILYQNYDAYVARLRTTCYVGAKHLLHYSDATT